MLAELCPRDAVDVVADASGVAIDSGASRGDAGAASDTSTLLGATVGGATPASDKLAELLAASDTECRMDGDLASRADIVAARCSACLPFSLPDKATSR